MKQVRIAELKAKLSEFLRAVQAGESFAVLDRNTAIAQIVPLHERPGIRIRKPINGLRTSTHQFCCVWPSDSRMPYLNGAISSVVCRVRW
jgi:antitoxin (DNA-binding transcriptional repressor) of toxin-antitoxin stability system